MNTDPRILEFAKAMPKDLRIVMISASPFRVHARFGKAPVMLYISQKLEGTPSDFLAKHPELLGPDQKFHVIGVMAKEDGLWLAFAEDREVPADERA